MTQATSRELMAQYFGSYDHKIRTNSKESSDKLKMMQIRMIEGYADDHDDDHVWLERAARTIAELEASLNPEWRFKHLTGPAA